MATKDFKTIDEQIDILKNRGLSIPDKETAASFLLNNNYYRISGYSLTLRTHDKFHKNATFQNIIDIYEFDYELRHILLKYLEIIEVTFKSLYAHTFTRIYGPTGYLCEDNFIDSDKYSKIIEKADHQKDKRLRDEPYLKHYIEELNEDLPLWAYVDLLTIADISILYSISKNDVQIDVAKRYNIKSNILGKLMHSMTILRNLCAHGSRIYNRFFDQRPNLSSDEKKLLMTNKKGEKDNAHLFGFIIIIKRLLSPEDFLSMKSEIQAIIEKYPFVNMKYYGFNPDWENLL